MKIAVTHANGQVSQHFGKTSEFKVYEVSDKKVDNSYVLDCGDHAHESLVDLLVDNKVDVLICGSIGQGAQDVLKNKGISFYGGVCQNADDAVADFLNDKLNYDPDVKCTDHTHEHSDHDHEYGHSCSGHKKEDHDHDHDHEKGKGKKHGHCHGKKESHDAHDKKEKHDHEHSGEKKHQHGHAHGKKNGHTH